MKKVSIIVPVYNTPKAYLHACVDSLLAQTLDSYEIILVNDASTDDTLSRLQEYERANPDRIRIIDSPRNLHQGGARNLGIRAARGEYIAFMDSDDLALPHMYETLYQTALEHSADTVLCRWKRFSDDAQICGESQLPKVWREAPSEALREKLFLNPQSVCCKLYRRSMVLDNSLFFPENMFYEDNAWCPLCMLYVSRHACVDEALYLYRLNLASTTEGGNVEKYMDRCASAVWLQQELENRGLYTQYEAAADFWFYHCFWASSAKMCVDGFGKVYFRRLLALRQQVWPKRKRYFSNPYYVSDLRGYEAEEQFYQKILLYAPIVGVAAVKLISLLRRLKHGRR